MLFASTKSKLQQAYSPTTTKVEWNQAKQMVIGLEIDYHSHYLKIKANLNTKSK
jgi:hypothetical protein